MERITYIYQSGANHEPLENLLTSVVPQNADGLVRDKTAFHKANAKQVANPLEVLLIVLVSLDGLRPLGIGYHNTKTSPFENVKKVSTTLKPSSGKQGASGLMPDALKRRVSFAVRNALAVVSPPGYA